VLHRLENESAFFHVFGLQESKGAGALQKKKLLSPTEIDDLQNQLKRATEHLGRNESIFSKLQELAMSAAQNKYATESFILELANALADTGLDVGAMVEAAQVAGPGAQAALVSVPVHVTQEGAGSEGDKAKIAELEAQLNNSVDKGKVAELEAKLAAATAAAEAAAAAAAPGRVPATPRGEKDAAIRALEAKITELERIAAGASVALAAASESSSSSGGGDAALRKELAETKVLLVSKENEYKKQIAEAHEAERAAKAKLHEQNDELQTLRDASGSPVKNTNTGTPVDDQRVQTLQKQVSELEKEKAQLKGETIRLQGALDLAKAEADKDNKKSGSCQVQ
jgi:hypothetical protein